MPLQLSNGSTKNFNPAYAGWMTNNEIVQIFLIFTHKSEQVNKTVNIQKQAIAAHVLTIFMEDRSQGSIKTISYKYITLIPFSSTFHNFQNAFSHQNCIFYIYSNRLLAAQTKTEKHLWRMTDYGDIKMEMLYIISTCHTNIAVHRQRQITWRINVEIQQLKASFILNNRKR